ncbi:MAG: hypothetical protein QM770_24735 [Tepidisphaeraceae bacterium]
MSSDTGLSRSRYATQLRAYATEVADVTSAIDRCDRWAGTFVDRMGQAFDGRITLEVGCFDAEFLCHVAAKHPTRAFIGLDWKCKPLLDGAMRIRSAGLANVLLLRGRAQDVRQYFGVGELNDAWLFHPDPCDRPVELKNRLFSEAWLLDLHTTLRDDASTLTLKTDHPGYYQWALALLGLPMPAWFEPARQAHHSGGRLEGVPRIRAKDVVSADQLPPASRAACRAFEITMNSADFWEDAAALRQMLHEPFAGEATLFEQRFRAKRQPIYAMQLRRLSTKLLNDP